MKRKIIHLSIIVPILIIMAGSLHHKTGYPGIHKKEISTAGLMDYHDVAELTAALERLANNSPHAQLFTIGYGTDRKTDPTRTELYPIYALRVSASTDKTINDDISKNAVLFEAGMHPREWLPTESTLMLAEYLVEHARDKNSLVPELLDKVDVWLIPLSNPGGRAIDDTSGGDPRRFSRIPVAQGWRGNGDTRGCEYGVNVARNFSAGWASVNSTDCTNDPDGENDDKADNKDSDSPKHYRGFAPFSTSEAAALREFVQNHSISMAVVVHSNAEQIWNLWGDADAAGRGISELAEFSWRIYKLDNPNLALTRSKVGGGFGQFSGWLADISDSGGEPDNGTLRGIQTIYIELPFNKENYNGEYRYRADDNSNGFHPSGTAVLELIRRNFIPMAKELIYQGRSPGCPTVGGFPQKNKCPGRDFGLVGAKIGNGSKNTGRLSSYPAGCLGRIVNGICDQNPLAARDEMPTGKQNVFFRIQNFGCSAKSGNADVRLTVTVRPHNREQLIEQTEIKSFSNLSLQEARSGWFSLNVDKPDAEYTVTLEVRPSGGFRKGGSKDDFAKNDKKVFKFRAKAR